MDAVQEAWLIQTVEQQAKTIEALQKQIDVQRAEIEKQVRRRDSVALADSTKTMGFKAYVDATNEAEAITIIDTQMRLRQYAQDVYDGKRQPVNQAPVTEGGA